MRHVRRFWSFLSMIATLLFITAHLHAQVAIAPVASGPKSTSTPSQSDAGVVTGNGIEYHGGPVIATPNVYFIWYGNWDGNTGLGILPQFISDLSVTSYANINTTYSDNAGDTVSSLILMNNQVFDNYSQGSALSSSGVPDIVSNALASGALPTDSNGIYFVLTSLM